MCNVADDVGVILIHYYERDKMQPVFLDGEGQQRGPTKRRLEHFVESGDDFPIGFLPIKNISKDALSDTLCLGSIMMSSMTSNMYEAMCSCFSWRVSPCGHLRARSRPCWLHRRMPPSLMSVVKSLTAAGSVLSKAHPVGPSQDALRRGQLCLVGTHPARLLAGVAGRA